MISWSKVLIFPFNSWQSSLVSQTENIIVKMTYKVWLPRFFKYILKTKVQIRISWDEYQQAAFQSEHHFQVVGFQRDPWLLSSRGDLLTLLRYSRLLMIRMVMVSWFVFPLTVYYPVSRFFQIAKSGRIDRIKFLFDSLSFLHRVSDCVWVFHLISA